jgi:hypothetical protein
MDMLTHQNVQLLHQVDYLPELLMFQSDPSKLSPVLTVVNLVLNTLTIVKFVVLTDLTHHIVDVSLDTIKMLMTPPVLNVNHVTTCVLLVKIQLTGVYVHVPVTESIAHLVLALMVTMMI